MNKDITKAGTLAYSLKLADVIIQCIAIGWPLLQKEPLIAYLAIGVVQVLSCIVNACALKKRYRHKLRKFYEVLLICIILILMFFTLVSGNNVERAPAITQFICIALTVAMIITITLMAVAYLLFSIKELQIIDDSYNNYIQQHHEK